MKIVVCVLGAASGSMMPTSPVFTCCMKSTYSNITLLREPAVSRETGVNPASVYLIGSRLTRQMKNEVAALRAQLEHG